MVSQNGIEAAGAVRRSIRVGIGPTATAGPARAASCWSGAAARTIVWPFVHEPATALPPP